MWQDGSSTWGSTSLLCADSCSCDDCGRQVRETVHRWFWLGGQGFLDTGLVGCVGGRWRDAAGPAVGSAAVVPALDVVHYAGPGSQPRTEGFVVVELGFEVFSATALAQHTPTASIDWVTPWSPHQL